jgi:uncharacterized protein
MKPGRAVVPRLVLDTNTVVSALLFPSGRLSWIRLAWQAGRLLPLLSTATANELIRVLTYPKFKLTQEEQEYLLADYLPWCEVIDDLILLEKPVECRDPADLPFLSLALVSEADALISGDKDLLVLKQSFAVAILAPDELRLMYPGITGEET